MRIKGVFIKNYRQFQNVEINFNYSSQNDLHIFISENGSGKTNLFNAINWCLYNKEPFQTGSRDNSNKEEKMPILNLKTLTASILNYSSKKPINTVSVELTLELDDGRTAYIIREKDFLVKNPDEVKEYLVEITDCLGNSVHSNSIDKIFEFMASEKNMRNIDIKQPKLEQINNNLVVKKPTQGNDYKIIENDGEEDGASNFIEKFVPRDIRQFFFFDGEQLDDYFQIETGKNLKEAVHQVAKIDLLENIEYRLEKLNKDFRKKSRDLSPNIEKKEKELSKKEDKVNNYEDDLEDINEQINLLENQLKVKREELDSLIVSEDKFPSELKEEKEELEKKLGEVEENKDKKIKQKQKYLVRMCKMIGAWPAIKHTNDMIIEKRENREIPPAIDIEFLEQMLNENRCLVCSTEIGSEEEETKERKAVEEIKSHISHSQSEAHLLTDLGVVIRTIQNDNLDNFENSLIELNQEIKGCETDIGEIEEKIIEIENILDNVDVERIQSLRREIGNAEDARDNQIERRGSLEELLKNAKSQRDEAKRKYQKALKKDKEAKEIKEQMRFLEKGMHIVKNVMGEIISETRENIQKTTQEKFMELNRKNRIFESVEASKDYELRVGTYFNYGATGDLSGAETELLALAFILAVHEVSGFDSPIMIDSPIHRVSDDNRINFINSLIDISKRKEIILTFTPDDITPNIEDVLFEGANTKNKFELDENEVKVEVKRYA